VIRLKPPKEGTVFLVPLEDSRFVIGLLIRVDKKGRAYGEFYGPKIIDVNSVPSQAMEISQLLRSDRLLMKCKFGDHGLCQRRWIALGQVSGWDRKKWPLPQFYRPHDDKSHCFVTVYDDELNLVSESIQPFEMGKGLPLDEQLGSNVVEKKLSALL
jgi:hypothetical protein